MPVALLSDHIFATEKSFLMFTMINKASISANFASASFCLRARIPIHKFFLSLLCTLIPHLICLFPGGHRLSRHEETRIPIIWEVKLKVWRFSKEPRKFLHRATSMPKLCQIQQSSPLSCKCTYWHAQEFKINLLDYAYILKHLCIRHIL